MNMHITKPSVNDLLKLTRNELFNFENMMKSSDLQIDLQTEHFFSPGIYTRILYIPKGVILTGKIHKEPILNIMVKGEISVLLGAEVKRIIAPFICVSPAGSKKIGFAHEDTIWIGCHGTEETDLTKLEERFVASSENEYLNSMKQLELGLE